MNYLAHAYLSFKDPEIITGNLISDFVKGKKKFDYPPKILAGINLHRAIDSFTDEHVINKEAAQLFKPAYGLYAPAFIDVVYDHFLAVEINKDGEDEFLDFTRMVYESISDYTHILPDTFNNIFPYMKQHNWLYNYQHSWGIERSMEGLVHRAKYLDDSKTAFRLFNEHYNELREAFAAFFPDLYKHSLEKFTDIH